MFMLQIEDTCLNIMWSKTFQVYPEILVPNVYDWKIKRWLKAAFNYNTYNYLKINYWCTGTQTSCQTCAETHSLALTHDYTHSRTLTFTRTHAPGHTHTLHTHTHTHTQHTRSLSLTHTHTQTSLCLHKRFNAVIITQTSSLDQLMQMTHTQTLRAHNER